jgi:hypothetical protein
MARTEVGSSNTICMVVDDAITHSLIKLVDFLRQLGVYDEGGMMFYRELDMWAQDKLQCRPWQCN